MKDQQSSVNSGGVMSVEWNKSRCVRSEEKVHFDETKEEPGEEGH